jgi:hypothetical protein
VKTAFQGILVCALAVLPLCASAVSITVWNEDFSDVSDWQIISDPGGGSTITTDGDLAALYVDKASEQAAFGPKTDGSSAFVPFDRDNPHIYSMHFTVDSITYSLSYDIALDLFDAGENYLATVWQVFPESSTSTFVGYTNVNLGTFSYHADTVYLMPKITVHTGDGGQTAYFDEMHFEEEQIPEPHVTFLLFVGAATLVAKYRRHTT